MTEPHLSKGKYDDCTIGSEYGDYKKKKQKLEQEQNYVYDIDDKEIEFIVERIKLEKAMEKQLKAGGDGQLLNRAKDLLKEKISDLLPEEKIKKLVDTVYEKLSEQEDNCNKILSKQKPFAPMIIEPVLDQCLAHILDNIGINKGEGKALFINNKGTLSLNEKAIDNSVKCFVDKILKERSPEFPKGLQEAVGELGKKCEEKLDISFGSVMSNLLNTVIKAASPDTIIASILSMTHTQDPQKQISR